MTRNYATTLSPWIANDGWKSIPLRSIFYFWIFIKESFRMQNSSSPSDIRTIGWIPLSIISLRMIAPPIG
jgi:hypothetical protein